HEQRDADENRVADQVAHAGGRVSRRVQRLCLEVADLEVLLVFEQLIELTAVTGKLAAGIEDFAEHLLYFTNMCADGETPSGVLLNPGCGGKVVRMNVGFQQPVHGELLVTHEIDQP